MHTIKSLTAISVAMLLTACGDKDATFTPLGKPATIAETAVVETAVVETPVVETIVIETPVVEIIAEPIVVNDLPCVITVRADLPTAIGKFENACGVTIYRNCLIVDYGTYQCSNKPPAETLQLVEPTIEPEPEISIPEVIQEPIEETITEPDPLPLPEVEEPEISIPEVIEEVAVIEPPVVVKKPEVKKPVVKKPPKKPALRPIPRPTNIESSQAYVERHDLVIDYDDVAESNITTYGKLWAHVILNLGGDVWIAGHSDNVAAVLEYVATFYPDVNTRNIKVVTKRDDNDINTATYKTIDRYATLLEVDDENDIDITIASNSISAVSHNDGKLIVPDDLYPIGP